MKYLTGNSEFHSKTIQSIIITVGKNINNFSSLHITEYMDEQEAMQIIRGIPNLFGTHMELDADTVIVKIKDNKRGPKNITPQSLATLLNHELVFDSWVEDDDFYVQLG